MVISRYQTALKTEREKTNGLETLALPVPI
jgi:hypothetical protein